MKLYCLHCDDLHKLRGSEFERAIYTMQLLLARAEIATPPGPEAQVDTVCLQYAADTSYDHPYRKRVDHAVDKRIEWGGGL